MTKNQPVTSPTKNISSRLSQYWWAATVAAGLAVAIWSWLPGSESEPQFSPSTHSAPNLANVSKTEAGEDRAPESSKNPSPTAEPSQGAVGPTSDISNWKQMHRCFPDIPPQAPGGPFQLDEVTPLLKSQFGQSPIFVEDLYTNYHIKMANGEVRRLRWMIEPNAEGGDVLQFQMFGVDQEGLPIPMPLPEDEKINPKPEVIERYKAMGQKAFEEKAQVYHYDNKAYVQTLSHNDEIVELKSSAKGNFLRCMGTNEGLRCECVERQ